MAADGGVAQRDLPGAFQVIIAAWIGAESEYGTAANCHLMGRVRSVAMPAHIWLRPGRHVTFIHPWPEHVERMRSHGLRISHVTGQEFTTPVCALHLTDAQHLARKRNPIDIAFVCKAKSYDTAWATRMVRSSIWRRTGSWCRCRTA